MDVKHTVTITAYKNDHDDPPEGVEGFFSFWREKIDLIPEEYRKTARIELDVIELYGESELRIEITYLRPETDEEQSRRECSAKENRTWTERQERAQLARLQEKYRGA